MTPEQEQLHFAAKAAGITGLTWDAKWGCLTDYEGITFNPLHDNGDSRKLEVACLMEMSHTSLKVTATVWAGDDSGWAEIEGEADLAECNNDREAATRLAVLRCAEQIWRAMV